MRKGRGSGANEVAEVRIVESKGEGTVQAIHNITFTNSGEFV